MAKLQLVMTKIVRNFLVKSRKVRHGASGRATLETCSTTPQQRKETAVDVESARLSTSPFLE